MSSPVRELAARSVALQHLEPTKVRTIFDLPLKSTTEISIATLMVVSFFLANRPPSPWFPALTYEERTYINDRNERTVQILPRTDASVSDYLEYARWRHDFPPPQNIVARQLAAASLRQSKSGKKKSLRWLPDEKKWEFLEPHDTDWLLVDFLSKHDDRRAGPWQHAKAQGRTLCNLFHVRFPHVEPSQITKVRSIPTSVSSRDVSDLHDDVPTCWQEPVKPFTVRFTDWDGRLRKMRIKPAPYDRNYFCKERMQQEGIQLVRENSIIKLVSDALGGARFKPVDDPLEYLQSFVPEDVPLHPTADPQALHEVDKEKFARRAAELRRFAANYERSPTLQVGSLSKPTKAQSKEWNEVLAKHGLKSELSGSEGLSRYIKSGCALFGNGLLPNMAGL